jgi:hypothetical protein
MSSSSSSTSSSNSKSCKQVMELFPKNYAIPYYFGSLAIQSGISHSYVYYDDGIKKIHTTSSDELTTNATTNTIATILSSFSRLGARTKIKTSDSNNQTDEKEEDGNTNKDNKSSSNNNKDDNDPIDGYNNQLKQKQSKKRYIRNPLKQLMPWERITPIEYKKRRNARKAKFCPRQNDMNNMIIELILDWYKCRDEQQQQQQPFLHQQQQQRHTSVSC